MGAIKTYNKDGIPGCVSSKKGILILNCQQAGFNTQAAWAVCCAKHLTISLSTSLKCAQSRASYPNRWCVLCSDPNFRIHEFEIKNDIEYWTMDNKKCSRNIWVATCVKCGRSNKYLGQQDLDSPTMANNMLYAFKVECQENK